MTESTIADFVADLVPDTARRSEPVRGRVVMSRRRLVLASDEGRTTIPLSAIFDVAVGHVPPDVSEFFDDTVTIGYREYDDQRTAIIQGDADTVDRFVSVLFRTTLNGVPATVRHPARVGGRVTDASAREATLRVGDGRVAFGDLEEPFAIDLESVTRYRKEDREIDGRVQPTLFVRHTLDGQSVATELTLDSPRTMNLLGRYLRLEYGELLSEVRDLEVPEAEMEVLVALYSGGESADIARLLGKDASTVTMLLNSLAQKGLVSRGPDSTSLTSKGRLLVGERIEDVNV